MKFKLPRKKKKKYKKDCWFPIMRKEEWEWFYFRRRIEVRCMEVILTYPNYDVETGKYEFDPKFRIDATNDQLLVWYMNHYPNDKLAYHYCCQNRHKWKKFNTKVK